MAASRKPRKAAARKTWEFAKVARTLPLGSIGERTVAPGVSGYCGVNSFRFHGQQSAIVAAGVAKPEWFSDGKQRDKRGRIVRTRYLEVEGRHITTVVKPRGAASVRVSFTEEERAKAEAARQEAKKNEAKPLSIEDIPVLKLPRVEGTIFEVGAFALWDGHTVEVTGEYAWYRVDSDDGPFMDVDGKFSVLPGYFVEDDDGEGFVPAHELRLCNGGISYLKLVK